MAVKIVEVAPRDGLQNEAVVFSVDDRVSLIRKLVDAGLNSLEGGSFVSPKAIPQLVDSEKVWEKIKDLKADLSFLVPNQKGLERALVAGVRSIAFFTATSDKFNQQNIRMTVDESLKQYKDLSKSAKEKGLRIRGYISTAFGCPYEGPQNPDRVVRLTKKLLELGCDEISIGDTIGVAHPRQIKEVFGRLEKEVGLGKLAGHFHDTRGNALVNIREAFNLGVRIFDSSVGGLGGCPYAKGSSGNVATEEVVWLLEGEGFKTGVSIEKLLEISKWLESKVEHELTSKLYRAQPKRIHYV